MPIATTTIARSCADLRPDAWVIVALKPWVPGREPLYWEYTMDRRDVAALTRGTNNGSIIAVQQREQDGTMTLFAKLPAVHGRKAA